MNHTKECVNECSVMSVPASSQSLLRPTPLAAHPASASAAAAAAPAVIGKSLVIKGEIGGSESIYVDGRVEGMINLPGHSVIVGANGEVNAAISALEVVVQGKLIGDVQASDRLEVRKEGSLTGDVIAERVSLADGAFFKGKIDIRRPGQDAEASGL